MEHSRGVEYPYDLTEAVENTAIKLGEICPTTQSGAVVYSRSPLISKTGEDYGAGLPGRVEIIENSLVYIPDSKIGLKALSSSAYLFIKAIKAAGAASVVLYMPAAALERDLPPVVAIEDQIDMLSRPPHVGVDPAGWEERFFPMNEAYDLETALEALKRVGLPDSSGILLGVALGQFDTPAGRVAASRMGAHLISVHIVGECLIAKRAGLNVIGFAETAGVDPETIGGLISAALK
jgi:hypothetical protein